MADADDDKLLIGDAVEDEVGIGCQHNAAQGRNAGALSTIRVLDKKACRLADARADTPSALWGVLRDPAKNPRQLS